MTMAVEERARVLLKEWRARSHTRFNGPPPEVPDTEMARYRKLANDLRAAWNALPEKCKQDAARRIAVLAERRRGEPAAFPSTGSDDMMD